MLSSVAPPLPILPLPVPPLTQSASAANHFAEAFSTVAPPLPILPLTVPPLTQAVSAANHLIAVALSAAPPPLPILPIPVRPAASSSATVVAAPIPVLSAAHSGGGGLPLVRSRSINRQKLVAHSTALESIQAESEPIDEEDDVP